MSGSAADLARTSAPGRRSVTGGMITGVSKQDALSSSQLVEMSTELPELVLKECPSWTNITFKGKGFAWVNHPENQAMIKAHHDERDALLATAPTVYEAGWTTNSSAWVRVRLELADAQEVLELLEEAWRMTATKRATKTFDDARDPSRVTRWELSPSDHESAWRGGERSPGLSLLPL